LGKGLSLGSENVAQNLGSLAQSCLKNVAVSWGPFCRSDWRVLIAWKAYHESDWESTLVMKQVLLGVGHLRGWLATEGSIAHDGGL